MQELDLQVLSARRINLDYLPLLPQSYILYTLVRWSQSSGRLDQRNSSSSLIGLPTLPGSLGMTLVVVGNTIIPVFTSFFPQVIYSLHCYTVHKSIGVA